MFRILFVDDEPNILKGLSRMLRNQHGRWKMFFVQNVEDALEIIHFNAVPGRDGFDLLSIIRNTERTHDVPVLMLTGLNDRCLKRKALDLGATDLLNKPADPEDLVARIKSMLRLKAYQNEIKAQNALLARKVKERTAELEFARIDLIWRLGRAAEYRDTTTGHHVIRVG
ncbi:MAG: response regulator [Desulfobacterium sp.]|nr:response regulator [Desulfobacterium sp.]